MSRRRWHGFTRNRTALAGLAVFCSILSISLLGPALVPDDPFIIRALPLLPPGSPQAWLGTDYLGRDIGLALLHGGRSTLVVGLTAGLVAAGMGTAVGCAAGYFGGWIDSAFSRLMEVFQVLPGLLLTMVVVVLFSPSLATVSIGIGLMIWAPQARVARAEFMRMRHLDYVRAGRAIGASDSHIIGRILLPNALPTLVVTTSLSTGHAILLEASVSYLGLSDSNQMSWGLMMGSNRQYLLEAWWTVSLPGLAIFLCVLSIILIGDGIADALNQRSA
jgi:peptide/nickel transport system permease protein